jgi:hypothetical protein
MKKRLARRCCDSHIALKYSCHPSRYSFRTRLPLRRNAFTMSTSQSASPVGFFPPHEELASLDLGGVVDYLKEVPTLFDLHQNNATQCDPRNSK